MLSDSFNPMKENNAGFLNPDAAAWFVVVIIVIIGVYDTVVGIYLLTSPTPWLAHGPGTIWSESGDLGLTGQSLYQRIGVFSFHVGILTVVLGCLGRTRAGLRTLLILIYLVTGIAFGRYDYHWFSGTLYWDVKLLLGTLFVAAAIVQFTGVWKNWWHTETGTDRPDPS